MTRPASTLNDMSDTACTEPKRLLSPSISMAVLFVIGAASYPTLRRAAEAAVLGNFAV